MRCTSNRVSQTALPVSSVICRASSSSRERTSSAAAIRISARRNGGSAATSASAAAADASACSTSASSASETRAISLPSYGKTTGRLSELVVGFPASSSGRLSAASHSLGHFDTSSGWRARMIVRRSGSACHQRSHSS